MARLFTPGRSPLTLPGTTKRALRRPDTRGLSLPNLSGAPLSTDEVDYDDLDILRSWRVYETGAASQVRYFCYELAQRNPGQDSPERYYKAVRLIRLTRVPRYLREMPAYEQMRDVLVSLREKRILFLNIIAKSPRLPLVFAYGVQGTGVTLEDACAQADEAFAALSICLDGTYQQLEYEPLTVEQGELLARYQAEWAHIAMARGRPMPQGTPVGSQALLDGNRSDVQNTNDALESFIRGMGDRSFMLSLVTYPLSPEDMTHAWRNIAHKLSAVRSDQQGSRGISAGVSLPLGLGTSFADGHGTTHGLTGSSGMGTSDGLSSSQSQGLSLTHTDGSSASASTTASDGVSHSVSDSHGTSTSLGQSLAHGQSISASESASASTSHSLGTSQSHTDGQSVSQGVSHSSTDAASVGHSQTATQGVSVGTSSSLTHGASTTASHGVNSGQSLSNGSSASSSWTNSLSKSMTAGQTLANSWSKSMADSLSQTWGLSSGTSDGLGQSQGNSSSSGVSGGFGSLGGDMSTGHTSTSSGNQGSNHGVSMSQTGGGTSSNGVGSSLSQSLSQALGLGESAGGSLGRSLSSTNSVGVSDSLSSGQSIAATVGQSVGQSQSLAQGLSNSLSHSEASGQSASIGQSAATTQGLTTGVGQGTGLSQGLSQGQSLSNGQSLSQGVSDGRTLGAGTSQSLSHGTSTGTSASDAHGASATNTSGASTATSQQQAVSDAWMVAMSRQASNTGSLGVVPSLSASISRQTFDEAKRSLGDLLEAQMNRYHEGVEGGGWLYQMFLVTEDRSTLVGASTLLKEAFWGPGKDNARLPAPFHTLVIEDAEEAGRLLTHAAAWTHYRKREPVAEIIEPHAYSSYVTAGEASAFAHPPTSEALGLLAQHDSMPVLAMPADRGSRDIYLGRIVNGERGRVDEARFGVDLSELTHILIQGVTGLGKTTTMMRLLEQASRLERTVVVPPTTADPQVKTFTARAGVLCFDWMQNMRDLARVVDPERFQLFSVSNPRLGAFRWNPLAIPHPSMDPGQWLGAQADNLAASFGLGEFGRSLIAEYLDKLYEANRLEDFVLRPQVVDPDTGVVTRPAIALPAIDEAQLPPGAVRVGASGQRYANVYSCSELSRLVSLEHLASMVCHQIEEMAKPEGARLMGTAMRDRLQSVWRRIQYYAPNAPMAAMVAADPDLVTRECLQVTDLIDPDRGLVTVIETDGLDLENRRVILGSVMLAVYRYGLHVGKGCFDHGGLGPGTFLVLEESHELFGAAGENEDRTSASMRANLYESMFRRARMTGLRLVAMTQNCGAIPAAVTSQTTTVVVHRTYDDEDRKRVFSLLNWSNMIGQQLREWRYLGEMPIGYAIVRLNARESYLESAPVQILVDPPALQPVTDEQLAALARARGTALR